MRTHNHALRPKARLAAFGAILTIVAVSPLLAGGSRPGAYELAIDTNWADNSVSIVNLRTGAEKSRINVGAKPYDIKTDQLGRFAYASLSGADKISVIDLQANLESAKIQVGESPRDMAMSADFSRLVVANSGSNSISVIDVATQKELHRIPVGLVPYGVGLADGDKTAIISNWGEGTISFVDLVAKKEINRVRVGHLPYTVAVSPTKGVAFTAAFGDDKVVVLDISSRSVLHEIPVGKSPWGIAINTDGGKLAVANFYSSSVSIISISDARIPAGYSVQTYELKGKRPGDRIEPSAVASKPTDPARTAAVEEEAGGVLRAKHVALADNTLVFTDLAGNTVNTIDLSTNSFLHSIPVGKAPYGIDFLPQGIRKITSSN
jgi:YVTN family beta-propeller protein